MSTGEVEVLAYFEDLPDGGGDTVVIRTEVDGVAPM
jgi:hypothetical protein